MPAKNKKEYAATHYKKNTATYKQSSRKRRERNQKWFYEIRKNSSCAKCGNNDHRCIEFHHLRDKEFELSYGVAKAYSMSRLEAELVKCEPLCANCHKILHYEESCLWYKKIENENIAEC